MILCSKGKMFSFRKALIVAYSSDYLPNLYLHHGPQAK